MMFKYLDKLHDGSAHFEKYGTSNPISKFLLNKFLGSIDSLVGFVNPESMLEIGCGEGHILKLIDRTDRNICGMDVSDESLSVARSQKYLGNVAIENYSIYDLNSSHSIYDLVICCEVLEHLTDPELALSKLREATKKYIILSVPNEPYWQLANLSRGKYFVSLGNTPGHYNNWSKKEFIEVVSKYFNVSEVKSPFPWTLILCEI